MAVTQEQLQEVRSQVADLRVSVASLTGAMNVTNQRLNDLITSLERANANRKWIIGTFMASTSVLVTIIGILIRYNI